MPRKFAIIGLGPAGFSCALTLKKLRSDFEITAIDEKGFDLLHSCSLPSAIEGKIPLEHLAENIGLEKMGIKILREKAISLDLAKKEVKTQKGTTVKFDSLLISTGAKPKVPPIKGLDKLLGKKVFLFHNYKDAEQFSKTLPKAKDIAVIGGGAIGVELSYALRKKGFQVKLIQMDSTLLPRAIDSEISDVLAEFLKEKGVEVLLGTTAKEFSETEISTDKGKYRYDIAALVVGVSPNFELAKGTTIESSQCGIKVNEFMETNVKCVYAAGDVAESFDFITKKNCAINLASPAYQQGIIVANNLMGKNMKYKGTLNTFVLKLDDFEIASTGMTEKSASENGFEAVSVKINGKTHYNWHPDAKDLVIKLVASRQGKILGAQAYGSGASSRIDVVSTALHSGISLNDFSMLELSYQPNVRQARDLLLVAADMLLAKLETKQ